MKKRPCHLCGSTNWPSPTTTCPLCVGDPEPEPDYDEDWNHCGQITDMDPELIKTT